MSPPSTDAPERSSPLVRFLLVLAGVAGVRLDRGARSLLAVGLAAGVLGVAAVAERSPAPFAWAFGFAAVYYLGNGLLLGTPFRTWAIARFGPGRSAAAYELACGALFIASGVALPLAARVGAGTLPLPREAAIVLAAAATVLGFGVKVWAAWVVGLDTYYYADLWSGRPNGPFVKSGPYRLLSNPMYGVGNLPLYAPALLAGSVPGLVFAGCCHAALWTFHFLVERPFVRRIYLGAAAP